MEQLIFIDKREEQSSSTEIRASKNFNPYIQFPQEGGSISVINVTLNNNFHKINPTNHWFVLECQGTAGSPYDPYVSHPESMEDGDFSASGLTVHMNTTLSPLDETYPVRARNVNSAGEIVTSGSMLYLQLYSLQNFAMTWSPSLALALGFTGDETLTTAGAYKHLTSSYPINVDVCLPSTLYLRSQALYDKMEMDSVISDRKNNTISIPCHAVEHNQTIFYGDIREYQEAESYTYVYPFRNSLIIPGNTTFSDLDFYITFDENDTVIESARERFTLCLLIQKNIFPTYIPDMNRLISSRIDLLMARGASGTTMKLTKTFNPPLRNVRSFQFYTNTFSNHFIRLVVMYSRASAGF